MATVEHGGGALVPTGKALVADDHVRLRPTTWREQLGLLVALPFIFALAAAIPMTAWGMLPSIVLGLLAGLLPSAVVYRGRRALGRARKQLAQPQLALPRIEKLASGAMVSNAVRCDALAHAALIRLELGDLEAALRWLAYPLRDGGSSVRARTPAVGYYGEAVRSVMAWLFPESGLTPTASWVLRPAHDASVVIGYDGVADMVAALRVLEACRGKPPAVVRRAWTELDVERLARRQPLLCTLVMGVAHRCDASLRAQLDARLVTLQASAQAIVVRRFPELQRADGDAYRLPALPSATAVARAAPAPLQALRASRGLTQWFPLVVRRGPWSAFLAVWCVLLGLGGGDGALLLVGAVAAVLSLGSLLHRRDRVRPLRAAGIDARPRLRELSMMATRGGPRTWGAAAPQPFDRGELMLVVGLARAQDALRAGDVASAHEQIGWWLDGLDSGTLASVDLHATASSALRVATLLGYRRAARHLYGTARAGNSPMLARRTGHGDAPRALWLARALHAWTEGRHAASVEMLDTAAERRAVGLDAFERELYGELLRRVAAAGFVVAPSLAPLIGPDPAPAWIEAVWPRVVPETVPPGTPPQEWPMLVATAEND